MDLPVAVDPASVTNVASLYPPRIWPEIDRPLKIFVYPLPSEFHEDAVNALLHDTQRPWRVRFYGDQATEILLHRFFQRNSAIRAEHPEQADLFYIPVYSAAFMSGNAMEAVARDAARHMLLKAVHYVRQRWPYWDRLGGQDHVLTVAYDHGSCLDVSVPRAEDNTLFRQVQQVLSRAILLQPDGELGPCFDPLRHVVIPPATDWDRVARAHRRLTTVAASVASQQQQHPSATATPAPTPAPASADDDRPAPSSVDWYAGEDPSAPTAPVPLAEHPLASVPAGREAALAAALNAGRESFAVFRGATSGEKQADRTQGTVMMYGYPSEQTRLPLVQLPRTRVTCNEEATRTRSYSRGVRQRMKALFADNPRVQMLSGRSPDYEGEMEGARFCVAPLGYATWSIRTFEALLMGCVPVIIADNTMHAFDSLVDWTKLAVAVREADYSRLEFILDRVTPARLAQLQEHGAWAWRAFSYPRGVWEGPDVDVSAYGMVVRELKWRMWGRPALGLHLWRQRLAKMRPVPPLPLPASTRPLLRLGPNTLQAPMAHPARMQPLCAAMAVPAHLWPAAERFVGMWNGVAAVAVYVDAAQVESAQQMLQQKQRPWLRVLLAPSAASDAAFPHNELANAAVAACEAEGARFTVLVGAEVVVPPHAYVGLLTDVQRTKWETPRALAVPAFDVPSLSRNELAALTAARLRALGTGAGGVEGGKAVQGHSASSPTVLQAQRTSLFWKAEAPYRSWYKFGYDPVLVLPRPAPRLDEDMQGGYPAKASLTYELVAAGVRIMVSVKGFAVTQPALEAGEWASVTAAPAYRGQVPGRDVDVVAWSCWRSFADKVEASFGFRAREPCWVPSGAWKIVNEQAGDVCMSRATS